jgi:hypothetical protein
VPQPLSLTDIWTYYPIGTSAFCWEQLSSTKASLVLTVNLPLPANRILGVDHQIEDRGLHLTGIDLDLPQVRNR